MEIVSTNYTIADYAHAVKRNEIQVNRDYQRSDKVWPASARSFLIETMILNYPLPKLYLFQRVDIKSRVTFKEIVDGQQRTRAIVDFFNDKLRLSRTLETPALRNATYSRLPEELQERFLNYSLSADIFVGATVESIREVFRRLNSYTVPLKPEEERHATFQGAFKWFIYHLTTKYDQFLADFGVFGEKQFIRMQDAKLLAEIADGFLHGIRTTDKNILHALYKDNDAEFADQNELQERFDGALARLSRWEDLYNSALAKHFMLYSLILAISHVSRPNDALQDVYRVNAPVEIDDTIATTNLGNLSEALSTAQESAELLDTGQKPSPLQEFIDASSSKTNVRDQRQTRFKWFCKALMDEV